MNSVDFFPLYLELCSSAEAQLLQPHMGDLINLKSVSKGLVCNHCFFL